MAVWRRRARWLTAPLCSGALINSPRPSGRLAARLLVIAWYTLYVFDARDSLWGGGRKGRALLNNCPLTSFCKGRGRALINKHSLWLVYLALVTLGLQFWACSKLFFNIFPQALLAIDYFFNSILAIPKLSRDVKMTEHGQVRMHILMRLIEGFFLYMFYFIVWCIFFR